MLFRSDNNKAKYISEIERLENLIISTENIASLYSIETLETDFPNLLKQIRSIKDDAVRYDIVHRQIKEIKVDEHPSIKCCKLVEVYLNGGDVISFLYYYKAKYKDDGKAFENIMTKNSSITLLEDISNCEYEIRFKRY